MTTPWKQTLSYVAVNQLWRHVGVPILYRRAIVNCDIDYELLDLENNDSDYSNTEQTEKWLTNIDIILANNFSHLVQEMYITLNVDIGVLYFLDETAILLNLV
ncbi:hypothetical protein IW148_005983 [Coemansia sp. RSA 1199]|nr:hypothetical protein IW148_005983 [Coemansia sp. RSA 1199]